MKSELQLYFERCKIFDWYYEFSDDGSVYNRGRDTKMKLLSEADGDPIKMKIFMAWQNHMFSGSSFGTEKIPEPTIELINEK